MALIQRLAVHRGLVAVQPVVGQVDNLIGKVPRLGSPPAKAHDVHLHGAVVVGGCSGHIVEVLQHAVYACWPGEVQSHVRSIATLVPGVLDIAVLAVLVQSAYAGNVACFIFVGLQKFPDVGKRASLCCEQGFVIGIARAIKRKQNQPIWVHVFERVVVDIGVAIWTVRCAHWIGRKVLAALGVVVALAVVVQAGFRVCILAWQAQVQAEALATDAGLAKGCVAGLPDQLARGIGGSLGSAQVVGVQPDHGVGTEPNAAYGLQVVAYVCNGRRVGLAQSLALGRVDQRDGLVGQIEVLAGELALRVELANELLVVVQEALRLHTNGLGNTLTTVVVAIAGKRFVLLSDGDELAQCVPYIFTPT